MIKPTSSSPAMGFLGSPLCPIHLITPYMGDSKMLICTNDPMSRSVSN